MEIVNYIIEYSTNIMEKWGIIVGFMLVFIECFIPALPLSVFVALNVNAYGFIVGCLISWIATCLGSFCCYSIFYYIDSKLSDKILGLKYVSKIKTKINNFKKIKFTDLVLILTLPFTPSSLINILSGITKMSRKKFLVSILIGKFFSIIFWGYIGKSLIESITDISTILYIVITLIIAYVISKIISRKMNID